MKFHREQAHKLEELKKVIIDTFESNRDVDMSSDWLQLVCDKFSNPDKFLIKKEGQKSFYVLAEEYIAKRKISYSHAKVFRVLMREVARFEGFIRTTEPTRQKFVFNLKSADDFSSV